MVTKKDLVIVVLATFCLTATMFTVIPTRSQNSEYDPWFDVNDDGKIDIVDISALAIAFQSTGDPIKNVFITNPSYVARNTWRNVSWINHTASWGWSYTPAGYGFTGAYSTMFIHLFVNDITPKPLGEMNTTVYVSGVAWNISGIPATIEHFEPNGCNATIYSSSQLSPIDRSGIGEFKIKGDSIDWIYFNITSIMESGWIQVEAWTYLRND